MKRLFLIAMAAMLAIGVQAQPTRRRTTTSNAAAQTRGEQAKQTSDRAALMFPTSEEMPEDVVWRRDIYRQLDLDLDKNAPLYYPVEPVGNQCNLFTYLFRLFLTGRVSAYNYKLDGNESFAAKDRITDVKELLDRYYIYYEEKDGKYTVADNDVPSAFVKRYYVKESVYLDQRTGTYNTKVTAICPILLESDDFGDGSTSKPLFWMKYDDIAPYLSRLPVMASNYNNVTNMTADDFFTMNRYDGKIYKTNNMQGRVLSDYVKSDTIQDKERALAGVQKKIEKQLSDFEEGIWHVKEPVDSLDTLATDDKAMEKKVKAQKKNADKESEKAVSSGSTRRASSGNSTKEKKPKSSSANTSTAPRASARRERR